MWVKATDATVLAEDRHPNDVRVERESLRQHRALLKSDAGSGDGLASEACEYLCGGMPMMAATESSLARLTKSELEALQKSRKKIKQWIVQAGLDGNLSESEADALMRRLGLESR